MRDEARASQRSSIGWAAMTAGGLFVAITGIATSSTTQRGAAPGVRLAIVVPEAAALAIVAALALAALLMLVLLWPRDVRRRRKKDDEEIVFYYEPPEVSVWVWVLLALLALLPLGAVGGLLWSNRLALEGGGGPASTGPLSAPSAPGARDSTPAPTEKPAVSSTLFNVAVAVVATAIAVAALGVMLWLSFGDRFSRWWVGRIFDDAREPLRAAVAESLDDLRAEPDARRAIIGCYRRFERAVAASRVPRAPWQTAAEFMHAVLDRLALPRQAVARLTELFQISRFSRRHVGAAERDVACDCLEEIRAALEAGNDGSATA
jgi:hypothetical protein